MKLWDFYVQNSDSKINTALSIGNLLLFPYRLLGALSTYMYAVGIGRVLYKGVLVLRPICSAE